MGAPRPTLAAATIAGAALALTLAACSRAPRFAEAPMLSPEAARVFAASSGDAGPALAIVRAPTKGGDMPLFQGSRWQGHALCPKGRLAITLVVEVARGREIEASVELDAGDGSGTGTFRVKGSFDPAQSAARLTAEGWIDELADAEPLSFDGKVSERSTFQGRARGGRCTTFSLTLDGADGEDE